MRLSLIVAVADNHVIGRQGDLPWRLSADLRRFKTITMGHALIMGRKTYESIGRPLPGRRSIVVSRNPDLVVDGCQVAASWQAAVQLTGHEQEAFVIGGHQLFASALPVVDRLFWTQVHASVQGDVLFPEVAWSDWQMVHDERHEADERNQYPYSFREFVRTDSGQ